MAVVNAQAGSVVTLVDTAKPQIKAGGSGSSILQIVSQAIPQTQEQLVASTQHFNVGARIELFKVDATSCVAADGITVGGIYYFTPMQFSGVPVTFNGQQYEPLACVADGFEMNGQAAPAQPKLRVSNVGNLFGAAAITLSDLVGAIVYRTRTFKQFLDGQSSANVSAMYTQDIYTIQRKSTHNKQFLEFELSAGIDQENVYVPQRVVLKYTCLQIYRVWNPLLAGGAGAFDYTKTTCPFNGSQNGNKSYTLLDVQTTDQTQDVCSHVDSGCRARFPGQALKTWAFPGVGATSTV